MASKPFSEISVLGIRMAAVSVPEFIGAVVEWAKGSEKKFITYMNAHCVDLYRRDPAYRAAVDEADAVYADGQAVVWASRFLGAPLPERVNAGDFLPGFCERCGENGIRLFLLGSAGKYVEGAAARLRELVPGIDIAGYHHGFFGDDESGDVVETINRAKPDVLLVGMSAPRQELWAQKHLAALDVRVCWCVGALFEYYSGLRRRAPVWMRKAGLEWLFRLALEPRRLLKRYTVENILFICRMLNAKMTKRN